MGNYTSDYILRDVFIDSLELNSPAPCDYWSSCQSTVRKKMAAVHFTTIPCEPNRAISTHGKSYFGKSHPCTNKILYARFEVFRPFLCVFKSGFRIFVR